MMKKALCTVLCACLLAVMLAGCGDTDSEGPEQTSSGYVLVNEDALAGTEYSGYRVEVLSYEYDDAWQSYDGDSGTAAICIRFYFENGNEDPLYLLESFGIKAYQDDAELAYISLNAEDEEAANVAVSVKDGASIYCMMAFEVQSDSDVELIITEPTAEATVLLEFDMPK